ncbi:hypothetical protein BGAL_0003g00770 [Botrytis galanthina]|uniref:Uncharacterized protein n=1 Tax=Botrytis galanthina TaxID=278940 RepID=A0A4S8RGN2_9HELO|nr:hypothetical protein BGAL_0003g00770 [Botrytis galanthina]
MSKKKISMKLSKKNGESIDAVVVEMNQGPKRPMKKLKRYAIQSNGFFQEISNREMLRLARQRKRYGKEADYPSVR